jgi:diguanylate cyclase (GGDEF)-like protein
MLFANLMSEKLSHYITEPISYLKGLVSNITEKQNYGERSHLQSDDEIGALATGINSMLDNIKIRDDQLVNELAQRLVIEQKLDQLAYYDSQTKLPNRHAFTEHIHQLMGIGSQPNAHFYLLLLDLDYFKTVNDTYGHEAGDELLTQCGHRLRRILNEQDTVYRIGGDEFAIVLKAVKSIKDVETICQRIIKAVSQKFLIHTHEVYIGTSIGIAQFSKDKSRDSQLIKHADTAMYWAKAAGKNTYKFYSEEIEQANYYQQKLNLDLQDALKKQQFELYYQPIIHVETQAIIGFEALLRWHHPQQGYISPNIFIPMAETNGLIIQIGDWVIKAALKQLAHWQTQYHPLIFMNINISAKQFFDKRILDTVRLTLKNQQLDPSTVHFELTESILMEDVGKSTQVMRALRDMGTGIAVDDFGTGHSSMRYLKQFPINTIKVDKCFVRGLPTDTVDTAIVDAIFALAKSLKLDIVAEGVETQEQVDYLRKLGCKKVQGFFFNRPITVEEVELLLQASVQENPLIQ